MGLGPGAIFDRGESCIQIGCSQDIVGEAQGPTLGIELAVRGAEALSRAEENPISQTVQNEIVDENRAGK